MTHRELFNQLLHDENIHDNIDVQDGYEPDRYGNNIVTFAFEGKKDEDGKQTNGMFIVLFNKKGRIVRMQMATQVKGEKEWQTSLSERFEDFKSMFTGMEQ